MLALDNFYLISHDDDAANDYDADDDEADNDGKNASSSHWQKTEQYALDYSRLKPTNTVNQCQWHLQMYDTARAAANITFFVLVDEVWLVVCQSKSDFRIELQNFQT